MVSGQHSQPEKWDFDQCFLQETDSVHRCFGKQLRKWFSLADRKCSDVVS